MHKLLYEFTEKSRQLLLDNGYIHHVKRKKFMFSYGDYEFAQSGEQLRDDIYKFINYLYDYFLLNEQEAVNVKLWDELMIWVAALGIADVVREQFQSIYPKYDEVTQYSINIFSSQVTTVISSSSGLSGGGGSTSRSGGGGSFGGGRGGGTR